jgi:predicted ester cyclase
MFAPDYLEHIPRPGQEPGMGYKGRVSGAFADLVLDIDDLIAEAGPDRASLHTARRHDGEVAGIPALGQRMSSDGTGLRPASRGKDRRPTAGHDELTLHQQIGAIPAAGAASG